MNGELYQYLVLYKKLNIPGVGTFQLERKPADIDFVNKMVNPPAYTVALHHGNTVPSGNVFSWLASALNVSETDAIRRFNDFAFDIKNRVMSEGKFHWEGVGILSKGMAGEIRFDPSLKDMKTGTPVPAVKVIRGNVEHTMLVGEQEKTSSEMIELLAPSAGRKTHWWGIALIVGLLAFVVIALYLSSNGVNTSSTGNQKKISPNEEAATYKTTP